MQVLLSGVLGTLLADYLWLKAAALTDSLSASLSLTLSIPFSLLADTFLRGRPPSVLQLLAALPIAASFAGAASVDRGNKGRNETRGADSDRLLSPDSDSD